MKKTITFLAIFLTYGIQAQVPSIQWQKSMGGSGFDSVQSTQTTSDGGYVMAGYSASVQGDVTGNHGNNDYWIVKLNPAGTIQWQKSLGGSQNDEAQSIQTTSDGGYIVAGYSRSNQGDVTGNHQGNDYWIVKLDATATIQWQKSLGGSASDYAFAIQTTSDGGYVVAGWSDSTDGNVTGNHGGQDYWIVKLDATGVIQWQKSLGGTGSEIAYSIQQTLDGGYIVAGQSNSIDGDVTANHGSFDYWIVKLDVTGTIQWQKSLGGTSYDKANSIMSTTDGGYIVAGASFSTNGDVTGNHGSYDYWVVKLDNNGAIQWQKCLGGSDVDDSATIQTTADGGYVVTGRSFSNDGDVTGNHGASDSWTVKLDATGTIQWQKSMGGSGLDFANSIVTTTEGGYVIAAASTSINGDVTGNHGNLDAWAVKLAPEALSTPIFEKQALVIYPNPVCDVLQIHVPTNKIITRTKIINVSGKVVLEQIENTTAINVEKLVQGIYILEAYSGEEKYTSKFVKE